MAYVDVETAIADFRIVLSGNKRHEPLPEDFPATTDFVLTEGGYSEPESALAGLRKDNVSSEASVFVHFEEVDFDPMDELREYAEKLQVPFVALESASHLDETKRLDQDEGSFTFNVPVYKALIYMASIKLAKHDSPGPTDANIISKYATHLYGGIMAEGLPHLVGFRNLLMAEKALAFIEENTVDNARKPHAVLSVGNGHVGIKDSLRLSSEERIEQIRGYNDYLKQSYRPELFHLGFGIVKPEGWNYEQSFSYSAPRLRGLIKP